MKPVAWIDDARERMRALPPEAQRDAGYQLELLQRGREPRDWKPMPSIGLGVSEIRVRAGGAFRVIYVAKFAEAIYVLHVFEKKSQKTSRLDTELARRRYRSMLAGRRQR